MGLFPVCQCFGFGVMLWFCLIAFGFDFCGLFDSVSGYFTSWVSLWVYLLLFVVAVCFGLDLLFSSLSCLFVFVCVFSCFLFLFVALI